MISIARGLARRPPEPPGNAPGMPGACQPKRPVM